MAVGGGKKIDDQEELGYFKTKLENEVAVYFGKEIPMKPPLVEFLEKGRTKTNKKQNGEGVKEFKCDEKRKSVRGE